MFTENIKLLLQKALPERLAKAIIRTWRRTLLPAVTKLNQLRVRNFVKEQLVELTHESLKFKLYINPNNGGVDNFIFLHGIYEKPLLTRLKKELRSGDTFVDVGANIGQHSLFAAHVVGETGKVISFEPIENLYRQFTRSIAANKKEKPWLNIEPHCLGAGETSHSAPIFFSRQNMGGSSLVISDGTQGFRQIQIVNLDDFLGEESQINFIKIDVEGYEYYVLKGLKAIISQHRPKIIFEYSPGFYKQLGETHAFEIYDFLSGLNYKIVDLENLDKIIDHTYIQQLQKDNIGQTNLFAIPT